MAIFNNFPYTNFHELNLDWVLSKMKELDVKVDSFPSYIDKYIDGKLTDEALLALIYEAIMNYGMVINVKAPPEGLSPAVGDGATDDTGAIQAAIDYAGKVKGTVFFPSGTYKTMTTLDIPSNVSLIGFSPYNTKIALASDADACIDVYNNTNIKIEGLSINCNSLGETTDSVCITGSQVQNLEISKCRIGFANDGIVATIKGAMYIKDVYLYSIGHIGAELNRQTTSAVLTIDGLEAAAFSTSSENVLVTNVNNAVINNICFRTKCSIACEIAGNNCQVTGRINIATTKYLDAGTGNTFVLNDEIKTNAPIEASNVKVTAPVKYETPSAYNSYFKTVKMVDKNSNKEYNVLVEGDELPELGATVSVTGLNLSNVVFFGDSYTQGYTPSGTVQTFCEKFSALAGVETYQRFGGGGCGFAHTSASLNMNFLEYFNSIKINNPTAVTTFFIEGGWNDIDQTESNIASGMSALVAAIKSKCPNATIVYMVNPSFSVIKSNILRKLIAQANALGLVTIDTSWWWILGEPNLFADDRIHPNENGHSRIARALYTTLMGGTYEHKYLYNANANTGWTVNIIYSNDIVSLYISGTKSASHSDTTITLSDVFFKGNSSGGFRTPHRLVTPIGDDSTDQDGFAFISFGNTSGSGNILCKSSRKINDSSTYASGSIKFNYSAPADIIFG